MPLSRRLRSPLVIGLAFAAGSATANPSQGFFLGADFGTVEPDVCDETSCLAGTEYAHRLVGGYRFNDYFALEVDRTDSRRHRWTGATTSRRTELAQYSLRLTGFVPVTPEASLVWMIGGNYWDARETDRGGGTQHTMDDSDLMVGVGVETRVSDNVRFRFQFEHTDADIQSWMAGFRANIF